MMIILGLDPGLACTGWGVIAAEGSRLRHLANGQIRTDAKAALAQRLVEIHGRLCAVLDEHGPDGAAVEEVFVNENGQSTLKLGHARGVILLAAARSGLQVGEYAPSLVKKAVVGTGGADKTQVHAMIGTPVAGREDHGRGCGRCAGRGDHPRPSSRARGAPWKAGRLDRVLPNPNEVGVP
jgi:crossover junction endodeoxyribonuclease RuvC